MSSRPKGIYKFICLYLQYNIQLLQVGQSIEPTEGIRVKCGHIPPQRKQASTLHVLEKISSPQLMLTVRSWLHCMPAAHIWKSVFWNLVHCLSFKPPPKEIRETWGLLAGWHFCPLPAAVCTKSQPNLARSTGSPWFVLLRLLCLGSRLSYSDENDISLGSLCLRVYWVAAQHAVETRCG